MNAYNNRAQLDAGKFNLDTEGALMRRALSAKMLGGMGGGPRDPRDKFGGGQVTPEMSEMLARYGNKADADVTSGAYRINPAMSSLPKSGLLEKIGGAAGVGSGILSALGQIGGNPDIGRSDQLAGGGRPNLPYQPVPRANLNPLLNARRNVPEIGELI